MSKLSDKHGDDPDFAAFCDRYGDDIGEEILMAITEHNESSDWPWQIIWMSVERHNQINETIKGTVKYRARYWDFEVDSGNWNGTVIRTWERAYLQPIKDLHRLSPWAFAPIEAILARHVVDDAAPILNIMSNKLLQRENTSAG